RQKSGEEIGTIISEVRDGEHYDKKKHKTDNHQGTFQYQNLPKHTHDRTAVISVLCDIASRRQIEPVVRQNYEILRECLGECDQTIGLHPKYAHKIRQ